MLPKYREIQNPLLLEIFNRGGRIRPKDKYHGKNIYESLADYFKLSEEELSLEVDEPSQGKSRNKWENMVRWTRNDLVKKGLLSKKERGIWILTEKACKNLRSE